MCSEKIASLSSSAMCEILELASSKCPDIALGMMLQAYAGLRIVEVCSLRNEKHPEGGSITFSDRNIRVVIGSPSACLCVHNIPIEYAAMVKKAYTEHIEYLKGKCIDVRYPLFINSNGSELSVDGYIRRVKYFSTYLSRYVLDSDDTDILVVKQQLHTKGRNFSGETLRQWYYSNVLQLTEEKSDVEKRLQEVVS